MWEDPITLCKQITGWTLRKQVVADQYCKDVHLIFNQSSWLHYAWQGVSSVGWEVGKREANQALDSKSMCLGDNLQNIGLRPKFTIANQVMRLIWRWSLYPVLWLTKRSSYLLPVADPFWIGLHCCQLVCRSLNTPLTWCIKSYSFPF